MMCRIAGEVAKGQHGNRRAVPSLPGAVSGSGEIALFPDLPVNRRYIMRPGLHVFAQLAARPFVGNYRGSHLGQLDPYGFIDGNRLPGGRQIEHALQHLPTTLEFPDSLGAIAHLCKSLHQAAHGALMCRLKVDQSARRRRARFRSRVLFGQAVELRLQNSPYTILEAGSLGREPLIERWGNAVKIFEEALAIRLDEIAGMRGGVEARLEDRERIEPAFKNIEPNTFTIDLNKAGNMMINNAVELRQ